MLPDSSAEVGGDGGGGPNSWLDPIVNSSSSASLTLGFLCLLPFGSFLLYTLYTAHSPNTCFTIQNQTY